MTVAQERRRQCIQTQEPSLPIHAAGTASSGSSLQLVGGAPPIPEGQDGAAEQEMPRASMRRPHRCPTKVKPMPGGREEAHHPPHQNALVEQTLMIIQLPVSQVEAIVIDNAGKQREDWHQQD